ncbi:MAG: hypothetical protein Q8932_14750 [Bacteroidota bacterium]|nr:hypothetical protein [Bacteroidota bacterium]
MRNTLTLLLLFTASLVRAQDLTGIWQGHFRSTNLEARSTIFDQRYKFEVQIAQKDKQFEAITYSYLSSIFYGKAEARGTVNAKTGKVLLQEGKLIELRMTDGGGPCVMTCLLQYSKYGDDEFLEGSYGSMNVKDSSNCGRGTIFLRKVPVSDFYTEPFVARREKEIEKEKTVTGKDLAKNHAEPSGAPVRHPGGSPSTPAHPSRTPATGIRPTAPPSNRVAANKPPSTAGKPRSTAGTKKPPSATETNKPPAGGATAGGGKARAPVVREPALAKVETEKPANTDVPIRTDAGIQGHVDPTIIPDVLVSRSNELVKTLTVNTNEVTLSIYDDGVIDHDTVSVYVDKIQVIGHRMLTDKAIVVKLHLDESKSYHEVVMVADNEGDIPPNTSLMIVKAGDQQYEVRISSNEQKNAVVVFKYSKNK